MNAASGKFNIQMVVIEKDYMEGKSERYSRHLYDLYKLRPVITFDGNFAILVKEVREHRAAMKQTYPSSKLGIDAPVSYEDVIKNMLDIADDGYLHRNKESVIFTEK